MQKFFFLPTYLPYFTVTGNKQFLFLGLRHLVLKLGRQHFQEIPISNILFTRLNF